MTMRKLSSKQIKLADLHIEGLPLAEAHKQAGYEGKNDNARAASACEILKSPKVAAYIDEQRTKAAQNAEIDLTWLIEQGREILAAARKDKSHAAAVSALKELGVLTGERIERRDNTNRTVKDVSDFTDEELAAHLESGGSEGAASPETRAAGSDLVH